MKKLNNKGYLIVEVIVASVLAMTITYFLLDLTVKLKNKNDDALVDTLLITDKALITKEIMNDVNNNVLTGVYQDPDNGTDFYLYFKNGVAKEFKVEDSSIITYGDTYSKKISSYGNVESVSITCKDNDCETSNGILYIDIPFKTKYSDIDYGIHLVIPYNEKLDIFVPLEYNFDYTGNVQVFTVEKTGYYSLETWGAQGGYGNYDEIRGGYGGYSTGTTYLTKGTKLYIYVGGHPSNYAGGYNGGGNGNYTSSYPKEAGGGGGATHIATVSGLLSTLSSSQNNILIVAGGGGGASYTNKGGSGGGYTGENGISDSDYYGTGGSQTAGGYCIYYSNHSGSSSGSIGTFGQGGKADPLTSSSYTRYYAGGGGGGYYGGGGGTWSTSYSSSSYTGSGGGGSGYIGNSNLTNKYMACYKCNTSSSELTKTFSTTNISSTPISGYAKMNNGYAKITYIGENNYALYDAAGEYNFDVVKTGTYKLEVWGAQGGTGGYGSYVGGYGGYSTGTIYLSAKTKLYVYVGGYTTNYVGGYNGGGNGNYSSGYTTEAGGGGGATHIATVSGLLSTLSSSQSNLLIVAGGGGGSSYSQYGGDAGGYIGTNGKSAYSGNGYFGTGGTQIAGGHGVWSDWGSEDPETEGVFGKGGDADILTDYDYTRYYAGGGGGGYYGGGGGAWSSTSSSSSYAGGGGGGSGYIGNSNLNNKYMFCYKCTESTEVSTQTNATDNASSPPLSDYSKKGDGAAKITYLGK